MPLQVAPTKSNLQKAKRALVVAKNGYGLLDRKRAVLLRELMAVLDEARKAQTEANDNLAKAFGSLQAANIRLGADAVEEIAAGCEEAPELRILAKSVMGAWIPAVTMPPAARPTYSFTTTGAALDEAVLRFRSRSRPHRPLRRARELGHRAGAGDPEHAEARQRPAQRPHPAL